MSEKKELSQSSKERFASELKEKKEIEKRRKEGKIRLEDMSDEEHLWYTIRKKWREEGKKGTGGQNTTSGSCGYK